MFQLAECIDKNCQCIFCETGLRWLESETSDKELLIVYQQHHFIRTVGVLIYRARRNCMEVKVCYEYNYRDILKKVANEWTVRFLRNGIPIEAN